MDRGTGILAGPTSIFDLNRSGDTLVAEFRRRHCGDKSVTAPGGRFMGKLLVDANCIVGSVERGASFSLRRVLTRKLEASATLSLRAPETGP